MTNTPTLPTSKEAEAMTEDDPVCTDCGGTGITYQTERRCACQPREWRYDIMYGPDGETNYAWVYSDKGEMVCSTKLHHAIAIVDRFNALTAPAGDGVADWQTIETAPHACHVLAAYFDGECGEWVYSVVMSPPNHPFTRWMMLPEVLPERQIIAGDGVPSMVLVPRKPLTSHARTSPGPINCNLRLQMQGHEIEPACERCNGSCARDCPFFFVDGQARDVPLSASTPGGGK